MKKSKLKELINEHTKNKSIGDKELILHKYLHNHYSSSCNIILALLLAFIPLNAALFGIDTNPFAIAIQFFTVVSGIVLGVFI